MLSRRGMLRPECGRAFGGVVLNRKRMFCLGWAVAVSSVALAQSEGIAWVGATLEPIDGARIENAVVAAKDGKITYLGAGPAPAGYKVVDAKGLWIMPGWVDGLMTRGLKLPEAQANDPRPDSETVPAAMRPLNRKGIRPDLLAADCLDLDTALEPANRAGFAYALAMPGAGTLRGQGALIRLEKGDKAAVVLRSPIGQGAAFTPGQGGGFPSTAFGVIALFRQTMLDGQRYPMLSAEQRKGLEPLEGLGPVLRREQPLYFFANASREVERAMNLADEFNAKLVIVGGREAWRHADRLKKMGAGVIASIAFGNEPGQPNDPDSRQPEAFLAERKAEWREQTENLAKLHAAGITFSLTTQGDSPENFLANLRKAVAAGLPASVALRAITVHPAEMFGAADQIGTLKVGRDATLTVLSGDPFDSKTTVKNVVLNGKVVEAGS